MSDELMPSDGVTEMDPPAGFLRYRAFTGVGDLVAQGNPCVLGVTHARLPVRVVPGSTTRCITRLLSENLAEVRCYSSTGGAIECCGHGLLCSAAFWDARWEGSGHLLMGSAEIPFRADDTRYWLGFSRPEVIPTELSDDLQKIVPGKSLYSAQVGAASGYLLVELGEIDELIAMAPPGTALTALTDRALLVFARDYPDSPEGSDYRFRYFAPQYGSPEDIATGSAMRLLAAAVCERYPVAMLTALQCSPEGGVLYAEVDGDTVWVGGHVQETDNT